MKSPKPNLKDIREAIKELDGKFEVVLFGSQVEGNVRPNSDIDLAVLTRIKDKEQNMKIQYELFGIASLDYDIRVFELFSIYIQISVISQYKVIFGDPLEISEYFYSYRKKMDDCKTRILSNQFRNIQEQLDLMK
ncbi:MAG: nucleotidyltransferase domain-containing protein [Promethearchaeota archaeon]